MIDFNLLPDIIEKETLNMGEEFLNKKNINRLIETILSDETALESIAHNSYSHALGFYRISLCKTETRELRLHVWDNIIGPMSESMHEHNFDFISVILNGGFDNRSFLIRSLYEDEILLLDKVLLLDDTRKTEINNLLELNGVFFNEEYTLSRIYGIYGKNKVYGIRKPESYSHSFLRHVFLYDKEVKSLREGDIYFHGGERVHQLEFKTIQYTSTAIITKPNDILGGSLQRWCYNTSDKSNYARKLMSKNELRTLLITHLSKH